MITFTMSDEDAGKLVSLVRECAEYRPDYFGSLATVILWQLKKQAAMAQLPPVKEGCSQ